MKTGKGKGMGYHGGKARVGKTGHNKSFKDPAKVQTRTQSSKGLGINYSPEGMMQGKVDCNY